MKDSGVEWIGEIPVNWEMKKVKSFLRERSEKITQMRKFYLYIEIMA